MARQPKRQVAPRAWASPETYLFPFEVQIFGTDWGACPVEFWLFGEQRIRPAKILVGEARGAGVLASRGEFDVLINIPKLPQGKHWLLAICRDQGETIETKVPFEIARGAELDKEGRPTHRWLRRKMHFLAQRFPEGVDRLRGNRLISLKHRDLRRELVWGRLDPDLPRAPVDPGCNWYSIGPSVVRDGQVFGAPAGWDTAPISGRITSIAYDPNDTSVVYVGAAQGGVWKSTDGGLNWDAKSDFATSLAIGCVTVDPSVTDAAGRSTRIFAGTGEPNNSDSYYGMGMLFSDDGGDTWVTRGTATFTRDAFSRIVVDPANNQHLFAATDIGVFESTDEGNNWALIEAGVCFDLVVDWANPGGAELYVGRLGVGVRRSTDGGANWATLGGGLPAALGRIALAMAPGNSNVLYAAFSSGGGLTGIFRTADGGTNWVATGVPAGVGQTRYNFVLGVSPTNANTVLFGEVALWRTTNGGTNWTNVGRGSPGVHPDQHAVEFHPTDGTRVLVGNDGGCFYSIDSGQTYVHRNKDLATLQYFGLGLHSQWDAIMIGGTQDNGAQRYFGHPAWQGSALGDGAFAAINSTSDPRRWYETRWSSFPCFRSDTAGAPGSWSAKQSGIATNGNWFYPPFEMDANNSAVLYCGYDKLFRSSDHAQNWTDITGTLVDANTNITAIAVAPSDSNTLYVGMQDGKVFKVTFAAGAWTATDVTGAPLPAGQISDIAVDPTDPNRVFVTTSNLIFSEALGEFTNDHVFRSPDGGATWENASTGLAQANPVNTIVIDPADTDTLFIGADVGLFRSDDGGDSWSPWDQGLPNCSVQDLKFFAPLRLLRAATHGRSVWERPVDAAICPATDVYMRDNFVDTGLTTPTPSGVDHPFSAGDTVYWYQSVDIKVDSPDPATNLYQVPLAGVDYIQFEELDHNNPRRETNVHVFAQVHNRGHAPATDVKVRVFWANAGGGLPNLPAGFWTAFPDSDPADTSVWHPVGPARTLPLIRPGNPEIASWNWLVPADAPDHTCMLCAIQSAEDAVSTSSLVIATAVKNDNNVTLKNLHVDDVIPGATGAEASGPFFIDFTVPKKRVPIDLRLDPGTLPRGSKVHFFLTPFEATGAARHTFKAVTIRKRHNFKIRPRADEACGEATEYMRDRDFVFDADAARKSRDAGIFGIVPVDGHFSAAFFVQIPARAAKEGARHTFHVQQWVGNNHVGGSSYEFRIKIPKKARAKRSK